MASKVKILRGQKFFKNAKFSQFDEYLFEKLKLAVN